MNIIQADSSHISDIQQIANRSWQVTYSDIISQEQFDYMMVMMYSDTALNKQMAEQKHHFLLIRDNLESVYSGFVSYELNYKNQDKTKIHKLYLLPQYKGRGIGRLLIEEVMSYARSANNNYLTLNMNRNNESFGFYKQMGFEIVGEEDINIGNGYLMEDYIFEKKI